MSVVLTIASLIFGLFVLRLFASVIILIGYEIKIGYVAAKTDKRAVKYEERLEQAERMRVYVRKVADNRWVFIDGIVAGWITNYCERFDPYCIQRDTEELVAYVNAVRPLRSKRNQKEK